MAHGIFQVRSKQYLANEIFPHLSKESKRDIFFRSDKKKKLADIRVKDNEEEYTASIVKDKK